MKHSIECIQFEIPNWMCKNRIMVFIALVHQKELIYFISWPRRTIRVHVMLKNSYTQLRIAHDKSEHYAASVHVMTAHRSYGVAHKHSHSLCVSTSCPLNFRKQTAKDSNERFAVTTYQQHVCTHSSTQFSKNWGLL